tara:strand:- start:47 stop:364 length:318 start_codon:yes stop_codon:yes gene_type:complete
MEYYSFLPFQTAPISHKQYEKEQAVLNRKKRVTIKFNGSDITALPNGPLAIRAFTLDKIHAANPSDGWTMRDIQDDAAKQFPFRDKDYVYSVVRSVVLKYCNLKE